MGCRQDFHNYSTGRKLLEYVLCVGLAMGLVCGLWLYGCSRVDSSSTQPNIIWIVWDTVRADHMSLYGYGKSTTPYLDRWARKGRIFDNCISIANTTVPAHASMFTGYVPSEHGQNKGESYFDGVLTTVAELLRQKGYQTYMYSANPHISRRRNFSQGFDVAEHPWDKKYKQEALRVQRRKTIPEAYINKAPAELPSFGPFEFSVKASGELAQRGMQEWLKRKRSGPFFIFLNYMEAHRPYVSSESYRKRFMSSEQLNNSYKFSLSWLGVWSYTFGLKEYSEKEIEMTRLMYDATLAELDDLFKELMTWLDANNYLDDTVVILTSDHGEHLGEHHIMDHQYSVYEPLTCVPLVICYPKRFSRGRDSRPVVNFDLFPTVLELAGIEMPKGLQSKAVSLLRPQKRRVRMAECPAFSSSGFDIVKKELYQEFDPTPWRRTLRAIYQGDYKFIWASDGRCELFDLRVDAGELNNLVDTEPELAKKLRGIHDEWVAHFATTKCGTQLEPVITEQERLRLESLGYVAPRRGN